MAAAHAAASAMPSVPQTMALNGGNPGLASSVPTIAVKVMSATTLGLVRS